MNSELWLLALIPFLAWILARHRTMRALRRAEDEFVQSAAGYSSTELSELVKELSATLEPSPRVTSPTLRLDNSHIWNSPSGARIYKN